MKKSVLTQTGIVKVGEDCSDEETKPVKINVLSDEELFAACGGRTAHKYVSLVHKTYYCIFRLEDTHA